MSYPDVTVEIAFGIDPYVVPAPGDWVDVTADFFGASIKHGKQSALDEYQPANATIDLWNLERQYEANYAAGPHYPDIVGDTWIRVRTIADQLLTVQQQGIEAVGDTGWVGWAGTATVSRDTTQFHSGAASVKGVYNGAIAGYIGLEAGVPTSRPQPVVGRTYRAGAWFRTNRAGSYYFYLRFWQSDGTPIDAVQGLVVSANTWTEFAVEQVYPANAGAFAGVWANLYILQAPGAQAGDQIWIDDAYAQNEADLFTGLIDIDGWQPEWTRPQRITVQATGYTRALGVKALVDPWKQATLNAEPYACYPMFESGGIAYDISGSNRHGLYQGAAQLGQHDPVDDGRASGLLSDSEHLGYFEADYGWSGSGDFTVTLWFNSLSGIVQKFPLMFGLDRLLGKRAQLNVIPVTTGTYRLNFVIYETFSLFPTNLFNAGEWLWINIIRHGTTVDLYVNRFLIATGTSSATIGNGSMQVGRTIYDDPSGYLTAWPTLFDYEVSTADLDAMWAARDSWENDTAGPRLTKIFEQIGIDPAMGDFDTGTSLLAPAAIDGSSALTHARDVEKAELGGLYELGSGVIRFRERHAFHFAPYTTNQVTIGRGVGELPYEQIFPEQSVVYNEAVASREGGQTFVARDTSGRFLNRALSETGLLLQSDNEVADRVSWRVATLKDQVFFPAGVTLNPHADDALWPQVLGRFLEDRVTIKRTNAVGTVVTFVCRILGITHDIGKGQKWKTTWRLGPIQDGPTLWLIGVAGKSEIGVNTFVNY